MGETLSVFRVAVAILTWRLGTARPGGKTRLGEADRLRTGGSNIVLSTTAMIDCICGTVRILKTWLANMLKKEEVYPLP